MPVPRMTKASATATAIYDSDDPLEWCPLELKPGEGGRHYLGERPVHCGDVLELQGSNHEGRIGVRYERVAGSVVLHAWLRGHEFTARLERGMRFRWPQR